MQKDESFHRYIAAVQKAAADASDLANKKWFQDYAESLENNITGSISKKVKLSKEAGLSLLREPIWCSPEGFPLVKESFNMHYRERNRLLSDVINLNFRFISHFWEYFYINESCLCSLVQKQDNTTESKRLKNLKLFGEGKVGKAYLIGDTVTQKKYILKGINDISIKDPRAWFYSVKPQDLNNPIVSGALLTNQRGQQGFLTVGLTGFANQTMLHMILNMLLGDSKNYVYQYDAFICNSTEGYNIMDIATESDMSAYIRKGEWSDDELIGICDESIKQLFPVLHFLKQDSIGFCHNDLKARNVFVHKDEEDGRIYYRLADFDKSSITYRGVRFYNYASETLINNHVITQEPVAKLQSSAIVAMSGFAGATTNTSLMFNPYGYYLSHDLYTFVISLAFEPKIRPLLNNKKYKDGLFFRCLECFGRPDERSSVKRFHNLISNPPEKNSDSITVINNLMHTQGTNLVTNIDLIMKELQIAPFPVDRSFAEFIRSKPATIRTGVTGGVCISEDKPATSYLGKPFCDTLPYNNKIGQKTIYDNV